MIYKSVKLQKGITIISLVVTIVIMLILSSIIIRNVIIRADVGNLNNMYADAILLEQKVLIYYNKYNLIPKTETDITFTTPESIITTLGASRNINDNDTYYEIDISKLENVTTNYGTKKSGQDDIYIINEKTLTVYYLSGVEFEGEIYYRYPYNYSLINQ